ncbi:MAG: hypothetical protein WD069_15565 [Planctomycetales bacterium]
MLEALTIAFLVLWFLLGHVEEAPQGGRFSRQAWLARAAKQLLGYSLLGWIVLLSHPIATVAALMIGEREWARPLDTLLGVGLIVAAVATSAWTVKNRQSVQSRLESKQLRPL